MKTKFKFLKSFLLIFIGLLLFSGGAFWGYSKYREDLEAREKIRQARDEALLVQRIVEDAERRFLESESKVSSEETKRERFYLELKNALADKSERSEEIYTMRLNEALELCGVFRRQEYLDLVLDFVARQERSLPDVETANRIVVERGRATDAETNIAWAVEIMNWSWSHDFQEASREIRNRLHEKYGDSDYGKWLVDWLDISIEGGVKRRKESQRNFALRKIEL